MPSKVTITRAVVTIGDIDIEIAKTGDTTYLLTYGMLSYPVEGYDEAIAECELFAAQILPVAAARQQVEAAQAEAVNFTETQRDSHEQSVADASAEVTPDA